MAVKITQADIFQAARVLAVGISDHGLHPDVSNALRVLRAAGLTEDGYLIRRAVVRCGELAELLAGEED